MCALCRGPAFSRRPWPPVRLLDPGTPAALRRAVCWPAGNRRLFPLSGIFAKMATVDAPHSPRNTKVTMPPVDGLIGSLKCRAGNLRRHVVRVEQMAVGIGR